MNAVKVDSLTTAMGQAVAHQLGQWVVLLQLRSPTDAVRDREAARRVLSFGLSDQKEIDELIPPMLAGESPFFFLFSSEARFRGFLAIVRESGRFREQAFNPPQSWEKTSHEKA